MFPKGYFAQVYFDPEYWPPVTGSPPPPAVQYGLGGESHSDLFTGYDLSVDGYLHRRTH